MSSQQTVLLGAQLRHLVRLPVQGRRWALADHWRLSGHRSPWGGRHLGGIDAPRFSSAQGPVRDLPGLQRLDRADDSLGLVHKP